MFYFTILDQKKLKSNEGGRKKDISEKKHIEPIFGMRALNKKKHRTNFWKR